jgi:hypothetical protein
MKPVEMIPKDRSGARPDCPWGDSGLLAEDLRDNLGKATLQVTAGEADREQIELKKPNL